jgi:hypothetical protein
MEARLRTQDEFLQRYDAERSRSTFRRRFATRLSAS